MLTCCLFVYQVCTNMYLFCTKHSFVAYNENFNSVTLMWFAHISRNLFWHLSLSLWHNGGCHLRKHYYCHLRIVAVAIQVTEKNDCKITFGTWIESWFSGNVLFITYDLAQYSHLGTVALEYWLQSRWQWRKYRSENCYCHLDRGNEVWFQFDFVLST